MQGGNVNPCMGGGKEGGLSEVKYGLEQWRWGLHMDTAGYSSTEAAVPLTQRLLLSIHHLEDSGKMEAIMGGSLHCYSDDEMFIIRSGLRWVLRTVSGRQLAACRLLWWRQSDDVERPPNHS